MAEISCACSIQIAFHRRGPPAESPPPFMCGTRISPKDILTMLGYVSRERSGNKMGKECNKIKWDTWKNSYFKHVLEEILPSFSYSVRLYYLSQTVRSLSTFCSVRARERYTLYCKPAVLCDLHRVSQPLWVANWPHAKFSACASSQRTPAHKYTKICLDILLIIMHTWYFYQILFNSGSIDCLPK